MSLCNAGTVLSSGAGIALAWLCCKTFRLSSPDSLANVLGIYIRGRPDQPGSYVCCELHIGCSTLTGRIFLGDKVC